MNWRTATTRVCCIALAGLTFAACDGTTSVPSVDQLVAPMRRATVAFTGTVVRRGSNVPHVASTESTLVIRAQTVLHSPAFMRTLAGREVTLRVAGTGMPAPGARAVHLAYADVIGGGWSLVEVAGFAATAEQAAPLALWRARLDSAVGVVEDEQLRQLIKPAAAIVLATVDSIGARSDDALGERDPQWRTATLRVRQVFQGTAVRAGSLVPVAWPGSDDIAWRPGHIPEVGATRVFVLHDPREFAKSGAGFPAGTRYVVVRSRDILAAGDSSRVLRLLR